MRSRRVPKNCISHQKIEPANPLSIFTADEHAKGIDIAIFQALEILVSLTTTNMENQRNQEL
jgi:murein tripeptide amidase MpaA